jgi:glycerol-3-phosphate dehydrogenase (NAD(P)+)
MIAPRIAVVGAGAWGTTLSALIARVEPVTLVCHSPETAAAIEREHRNERRLPGIVLPPGIEATADVAAIGRAEDLVIFAVPSRHLREVAAMAAAHLPPEADVLSVVKGLEAGTFRRMTQLIGESANLAPHRLAALSGPNLAPEIARGLPASAVVAAEDPALAQRIGRRLGRREFRLYLNRDLLGVELCGALKNIVAISAGAADALGFGDNGKAGLITRGLAEMTRVGIAAGANPLTFAGLAGLGDLVATCGSRLSRNHRLGEELARGRRWVEIEADLPGVAEGAYTVDAALGYAATLGVEMPIAQEVHNALFEGKSVLRCLIDLLSRESKDELADYDRWAARLAGGAVSGREAGPPVGTGPGVETGPGVDGGGVKSTAT